MVRAYLNVRETGGAVFFLLRRENTRERWSPFKVEGDGGCSKKMYDGRSKKDDGRSNLARPSTFDLAVRRKRSRTFDGPRLP